MGGLEKCRPSGTKPEVLKGQAKRPGAGRRKEARGEARCAELPRARRPKRANRGGRDQSTADGRWQGQLPSTGKAAPELYTPLSANSGRNPERPPPLGARARLSLLQHPQTVPTSCSEPPRAAEPDTQPTKLRPKIQLPRAKQKGIPVRKFRHSGPHSLSS